MVEETTYTNDITIRKRCRRRSNALPLHNDINKNDTTTAGCTRLSMHQTQTQHNENYDDEYCESPLLERWVDAISSSSFQTTTKDSIVRNWNQDEWRYNISSQIFRLA